MGYSNQFFKAVGINQPQGKSLAEFAKATAIPKERLTYYNQDNILPSGSDLEKILDISGISKVGLALKMGRLDKDLIEAIQAQAEELVPLLGKHSPTIESPQTPCVETYRTSLGTLYQGDSYELLKSMASESVDMIFADPPFNLSKLYPSNMDDNIKVEKYIHWCQEWLDQCVRVLKHGGSLFIWNLPKWNAALANFLDGRLTFRHWVGVDIKYGLPIKGRLYPSHYALVYYVKGAKPNTFTPDRTPIQTCPKCYGDIKDYGGYKDKMNPLGVNLSDIWTDIPPVRHAKYKRRDGSNELSLKLMDRIIEMATKEGDVVFDPFGGSGTTYVAAELKGRKWVGCELGPTDVIVSRFDRINEDKVILQAYRSQLNKLFPDAVKEKRKACGHWISEDFEGLKNSNKDKQLPLV
jgi:site-specific DNA-methyltransferase (adenine-specific)